MSELMKGDARSAGTYVSVVVPVFNEEESLELLHSRLTEALMGLDRDYELIFVDDGSQDDSYSVMRRLHAQDERLRVTLPPAAQQLPGKHIAAHLGRARQNHHDHVDLVFAAQPAQPLLKGFCLRRGKPSA